MTSTPKQWKRWIHKAGLRPSYDTRQRREYGSYYFTGYGRHWRMACDGYLDMSEPFDQFDRWANSCEASMPMTAKTEAEFVALVKAMLEGEGRCDRP